MAVFRVQVNYSFGVTGKWSNVWHVSAADLSTAADIFNVTGVPLLIDLLNSQCTLVSTLISDLGNTDFISTPINLDGSSDAGGDLMPLFNSIKVLFTDGSFGRPDYKFFKGLLTEGGQEGGVIDFTTLGVVNAAVQAFLDAMDGESVPLVSIDNDQYINPSAQPNVQMRQMHRRRRRTTPTP